VIPVSLVPASIPVAGGETPRADRAEACRGRGEGRAVNAALLGAMRRIVGRDNAVDDPDVTAGYAVDWTGRWRGHTPVVVRPVDTGEVAAVIAWCAANGLAVVPQGGNTGLVGGGVPLHGEVVVSLRRLAGISAVDADAGQLTAGAGTSIADVELAATAAGWSYGIDLASRDTATVGGTVATNAGGLRVLRHGDTRQQLTGVQAVLGDGSVVEHLAGLVKDNTGYHLPSLLAGSEGTLGLVTAARLRLVPRFGHRVVALVGLPSMADAVALAGQVRREVADVDAVEFLTAACRRLVGLPLPLDEEHPIYVLVECAGHDDPTAGLAAVVGDLPAAVAGPSEPGRRADLWRYREGITDAVNALGPPVKLDVTLPASQLARFVHDVAGVVPTGAGLWLFGHVADGNVHVNVTGTDPTAEAVDDAVLRLVVDRGGSISAEHGIGHAKQPWLHLMRSPEELAAMRAIKQALDPAGILNPRVLLP
jgi:FAD/FMN-containing dehydrogenase